MGSMSSGSPSIPSSTSSQSSTSASGMRWYLPLRANTITHRIIATILQVGLAEPFEDNYRNLPRRLLAIFIEDRHLRSLLTEQALALGSTGESRLGLKTLGPDLHRRGGVRH